MEEVIEVDLTATIANCRKQQKRNVRGMSKKKTTKGRKKEREEVVAGGTQNLPGSVGGLNEGPPGITISVFDYSVEEHFRAVDMIYKLCGEECEFDQSEIERLNSSVTFLREWRHFNYQPKVIRFACQSESTQGKDVIGGINLPQFSSATVPKKDRQNGSTLSSESSKDFVMHVGGSVWALDWCPRSHQSSDCEITSEFIAVAAHPPESSYHKIGVPLTGRGVIQIWCLLNVSMKKDVPQVKKKPNQNPRKSDIIKDKSTQQQKPRGRPKKKPTVEAVDNLDGNNHLVEAIAIQFPDDSSKLVLTDGLSGDTQERVAKKDSGRPRNGGTIKVKSAQSKKPKGRPRKKPTVESVDNLDGDNHLMQAIAVQFPDDSSKLVLNDGLSGDIQERVANKHSGRKRKDSSQLVSVEPKQDPRKGVKRSIIEFEDNLVGNNQYVQAIPIQFHDDSSKLLLTDGSGDTQETLAKNDSGIKRKGSSQAVSVEPKQDPRNSETTKVKSTKTQRPRGRPRKKTMNESVENLDLNHQYEKALVVQFPEDSSELLPIDAVSRDTYEQVAKRYSGRKQKSFSQGVSEYSALTPSAPSRLKGETRTGGHFPGNGLPLSKQNDKSSHVNPEMSSSCNSDPVGSSENVANNGSLETSPAKYSIPKDVALPRAVLCLAHNGKVAWDVKWQPSDVCESKHRMGYLAVLLGNGALEVWEVPSPRVIKVIYSACQKEGIDPRFVKLEPVFRCSMLKCGDRLSIPLTVEWSASSPHDLILAGCHDGVVALWKFSTSGSSKDTRPLLCFSADTVPIRALAWAPVESDPESANVIVTAGHKGLKFWDIRDPFRPLWDLNPVQRVIYSLDWLPDPRCVIVSFDDGTLRVLSLSKAAYDVPVTGQPFIGTQQQGLHSYYCSSFTIWSVQVSRLTGLVAYCSADGTVLRFQLTTKAVEKDPLRNRAPHFLCGSIASDEESALTVITPLPDIPFPMKKSLNEWGNAPRTIRGFLSVSNQEKRAKEQMAKGQMSDEQPLAVCYSHDPGIEFGSDDTLEAQKNKQAPKTKITNKKKLKADQALVCRNEDPGNVQTEECDEVEVGNEIEVFPPKIVAMHRVRWNMNKGSERWLCYGGEGGIVRCQEI